MIDNLIIWPIAVQLIVAVVLLLFTKQTMTQKTISIVGSVLALLVAIGLFAKVWENGMLIMNAANGKAPFGIVFVADTFSATMVLLTSIAGLGVSIFSAAAVASQ